ncbi:MAG: hypothetical protein WCR46_24795 [Deltaproteobacteria bacterium]
MARRQTAKTNLARMHEKEKLFGKWNDLVMLLLTFIFITIGGSLIANTLQSYHWQKQKDINLLQSEKASAENVIKEVTSFLGSRYYKARRTLDAYYENENKDEINSRIREYDEIKNLWHSNTHKTNTMIKRYFGDNANKFLSHRIGLNFINIEISLKKLLNGHNANTDTLALSFDELDKSIILFDSALLDMLVNDKIGCFKSDFNNSIQIFNQ